MQSPGTADEFFTAAQQERLGDLMSRWRAARDAGRELPPNDQEELTTLIRDELRAAAERAAAILNRQHVGEPGA